VLLNKDPGCAPLGERLASGNRSYRRTFEQRRRAIRTLDALDKVTVYAISSCDSGKQAGALHKVLSMLIHVTGNIASGQDHIT
jgi:hypothetical protein